MSSNQTSNNANASKPSAQTTQTAPSSTTSATQSSDAAGPALSRNQYAKQGWGSRYNFMLSYQLKPWETEDWEEGNRILDVLREMDVEEQVEQGKK